MAEVPYSGVPQVAPNLPGTPGVHPNVSPDAFGLGLAQASERAGAGLASAGNELFQRAYAMQQLDQHADAIHAHAKTVDEIAEKKAEFHSLEGAAAKAQLPQYQQDIGKIIEENGKGLSSDFARAIYDEQTTALRSNTLESAALHAADEFKKYQIGTDESEAKAAVNQVGMFPENEKVYKDSLATIKSKSYMMQQHHDWSEPQRQDWETQYTSQAVALRVRSHADKGQLTEAQSVLQDARKEGKVTGATSVAAEDHIQYRRNAIVPRVEVPELMAGTGGYFGRGKVSEDAIYNAVSELGSVKPENIKPLIKEAAEAGVDLPAGLTEQQFLADKSIQKKVVKFKLKQLQDETGSANGAAIAWRKQVGESGESDEAFVRDFNSRLHKHLSEDDVNKVVDERAEELAPGDINFREHFNDKWRTETNAQRTAETQLYREQKTLVAEALRADPKTGKAPTSIDQVQDPEIHEIWESSQRIRNEFNHVFETNAKQGGYRVTDQNSAEFHDWIEKMKSQNATPEEKSAALDQNFTTKPWPQQFKDKAFEAQQALLKNEKANPPVEWAMKQFDGQLDGIKIKKDSPIDRQLRGEMRLLMEDYITEHKKPPSTEEVRTMGARLIGVSTKGWIFNTRLYQETIPNEKLKNEAAKIYLKEFNREPTEDELQHFWVVLNYRNQFGPKKTEKK